MDVRRQQLKCSGNHIYSSRGHRAGRMQVAAEHAHRRRSRTTSCTYAVGRPSGSAWRSRSRDRAEDARTCWAPLFLFFFLSRVRNLVCGGTYVINASFALHPSIAREPTSLLFLSLARRACRRIKIDARLPSY
jgi:hypothetical protein